ncbi:MAG: 50S ribosomal protein L25 [Desulfatiglans sp.]|jgi:large subunit ribosomal protein L25|nr:50S ribosomal protein L25 [Thermodesulfobacteriota bacterium]MEE4352931.1 50S ribosomal protein L25 [Desulfatiglans sp.]
MEQQVKLATQVRKSTGKGMARRLRRNSQIPAIFYGPNTQPIMLTVDCAQLSRVTATGAAENVILDLEIKSDEGAETRKVMLKEIMVHPVKGDYVHADFYEISMDREISVPIPIHLVNTPQGVTQGGILQHIRRELSISCLPDKLIDSLEVDVRDLDIGDSLHVRDLNLPEGITSNDEGHLTIAVVASPTVTAEAEAEEELEEGAEIEETTEETANKGIEGKPSSD